MTIFDEISIIANLLANQGKKPSVALIKAKLTQPVPLPLIISTLKGWQHEPEFISPKMTTNINEASKIQKKDNDEINQKIALALQPIQQELAELKVMLAKLIEKNTNKK